MTTRLTAINSIMNEMHDDVANISEEIVDREPSAAMKIIDGLIQKLKHLKANLRKDEI